MSASEIGCPCPVATTFGLSLASVSTERCATVRIGGKRRGRRTKFRLFGDIGNPRILIHRRQCVAGEQSFVRFAEKRDVSRHVSGRVNNAPTAHFINSHPPIELPTVLTPVRLWSLKISVTASAKVAIVVSPRKVSVAPCLGKSTAITSRSSARPSNACKTKTILGFTRAFVFVDYVLITKRRSQSLKSLRLCRFRLV